MKITFVINTADVDALDALRTEVHSLRNDGHEVDAHVTFEGGDAHRFACAAARNGTTLLITAGGDGTINEVVNGLHEHLAMAKRTRDPRALPPRLGIVPLGTGNDLATALGVPEEPHAAVRAALEGTAQEVDVGRVNGRFFINVSTGGFGAEATEETSADVKRRLGPLAYVVTGVKKFVTLEVSRAKFLADELVYDGPFLLFAVGNYRRTGGGNYLTPRADLADGLLDLCIVTEMPRVDFLALLPDLRSGEHLSHPSVIYGQVPRVTVEADVPLSVNADGEPLSADRLHYSISSHHLLLVHPSHGAQRERSQQETTRSAEAPRVVQR